ncbi:hypothetical protein AYI69_g8324 [Smittium culicis]|uniref:Uncharacterized protein n=1 Tax=Smittium culicis TaxID=133412 RepID=A0A1R1XKC0_9FUNG|nr:hypothetical protein AYI69_g8324 [Smittium culicis]
MILFPGEKFSTESNYIPKYLFPADVPSRLTAQIEFSIYKEVFKMLETLFVSRKIDMFASHRNTHFQIYFSLYEYSYSVRKDALSAHGKCGFSHTISTLEPYTKWNREFTERKIEITSNSSSFTAGNNISNFDNIRPNKREISAIKELELVTECMKGKWGILKALGLVDAPIKKIISNKCSSDRGLLTNSLNIYKSAIMQLVSDPKHISSQPCYREFFKKINDRTVKNFAIPAVDICPIFKRAGEWRPSDELIISTLKSKFCWLLSVNVFLRTSDIKTIHL